MLQWYWISDNRAKCCNKIYLGVWLDVTFRNYCKEIIGQVCAWKHKIYSKLLASAAEYAASDWLNSVHTENLNLALHNLEVAQKTTMCMLICVCEYGALQDNEYLSKCPNVNENCRIVNLILGDGKPI